MKAIQKLSLFLLLTALLTACASPFAPVSSASDIAQSDLTPQVQIQMPESSSCILYVDQELEFTMEIPLDWLGKILIDSHSGVRDGSYCVGVYHREIYEKSDGFGCIFVLDICPGQWSEDDPPIQAGWSQLALQTENYAYFVRTPSGVEYPMDDERLSQEYLSMQDQLDYIKNHINAFYYSM